MSTPTIPLPIPADLQITTSDGTVLTASTDLSLAWKWAAHEVNAAEPGNWEAITYGAKCGHVAEALAELRRAYSVGTGE